MIRITVDDEATRTQLANVDGTVEVYDPTGKLLGRFYPDPDYRHHEQLTPDVGEDDLDRREQANEKAYTTAEVRKHLESL